MVLSSPQLQEIQALRHMVVAVVRDKVVFALLEEPVCFVDGVVPLLLARTQLHVLADAAESEVVDADGEVASEVVDGAGAGTDPDVADKGKQPREHGN
mmetsp:Transcript_2330/g.1675  ORF Transcript_2330/g.1675 Transcript_2330/m.1675 type:complete len:98 (+) Transcript_2330:136-429(+)